MPWTTESLLKAIGEAAPNDCITEERMADLTGYTDKQVQSACNNLRKHGFITRTGKGCHKLTEAGRLALTEGAKLRSGPKGPQQYGQRRRDPGLRQRAWNALRLGRKFTIDDILMRAVEGEERDAYSNIRKYVRALARAGYVLGMPTRETPLNRNSNGCIRWLLVTDTGPLAPVWRATRDAIYDPNLDKQIALARNAEGVAP